jgi:hypothetical protein
MTPQGDALDESAMIISEIESNLEKALKMRRDEVEQELQEKIRREKKESERKLSMIEREFVKEKETLKDYRGAISEFESARDNLQNQMRQHLELSIGYQQDIEKLAAQTLAELKKVSELSLQLAELRQSAEKKVTEMRSQLKEKYGIVTDLPKDKNNSEIVVDLEQELSKLKKIKELMETDGGSPAAEQNASKSNAVREPSREPLRQPEEPEFGEPEPPESKSLRSEFKMPEINQFIEDFIKRESESIPENVFEEPAKPKGEEEKTVHDGINFQAVFETLEKYRRSEATDYDGEISFFQNGNNMILDGESLIRAMSHILEEAKKLIQKLLHTESPKDQFFIKQELINNQEVLRKIVLRSVKMCEKESCRLPKYTSEILNVNMLKDFLEKLNMDNWSNQEDLNAFDDSVVKLKDVFYKKITPPVSYLRSIVQELEG